VLQFHEISPDIEIKVSTFEPYYGHGEYIQRRTQGLARRPALHTL
jgi:hypothetical protein